MDIKDRIDESTLKKIIGTQPRAREYLHILEPGLKFLAKDTWQKAVETWDYDRSRTILRDMFRTSDKYARAAESEELMNRSINDWHDMQLGTVAWPFSQNAFDAFVQGVNSMKNISPIEKDNLTMEAARKFRRIKEINTYRNDFIEMLIFEKNENIIPTFSHRRGVDYFIDGINYDQKVASSPTREFKAFYGDNWRQTAIDRPELVAEFLYKLQDEGRFGADPRVLVVYLDEGIKSERIRQMVNSANLATPRQVSFTYKHKLQGEVEYSVPCFIILLHN